MKVNRQLIILTIFLIPLVLVGCSFIYDWNPEITLSVVAALLSIGFGLLKISLESDKIFKDLFLSFNERYDWSFNDLMNEIRLDSVKVLSLKEKLVIIDYINLCSEEYLWYKKNRIPPKVWIAWEAGMITNLSIEQVNRIYQSEMSTEIGRVSYYGFTEYMDNKLKNG